MCELRPPVYASSYVDTVGLLVSRRPVNELYRAIKRYCGSCTLRRSQHPIARVRFVVHQPQPEVLRLLDQLISEKMGMIHEVHLALDLCTATAKDAAELADWVNARFVILWNRGRRANWVGEGRYTSQRKWRSQQVVAYADRPSKVTGSPCLHLEWRARGRAQVVALGVVEPLDLVAFGHRAFWSRRLVLEEANWDAVARQYTRKFGQGQQRRALGVVRRLASEHRPDGEPIITAQALRSLAPNLPWIDLRYALRRVDVGHLLP